MRCCLDPALRLVLSGVGMVPWASHELRLMKYILNIIQPLKHLLHNPSGVILVTWSLWYTFISIQVG